MANTYNRARTSDYRTLGLKQLKRYASYSVGQQFTLRWDSDFILQLKRQADSLFVFVDKVQGYRIPLEQTQVSFGRRWWYRCPCCERRCGVLYHHSGVFACRHCVKPAYESQNGSKIDYMAERIRKARVKLWHDLPSCLTDDLLASSKYWPKPNNSHQQRYERERAKVLAMEQQYKQLVPAKYLHFFGY